ncbi:hypothetical protein [Mycolicibacterium frederiksbergense]|nr:hypothetical protein [Mycolicibacterium frederiksbergense]
MSPLSREFGVGAEPVPVPGPNEAPVVAPRKFGAGRRRPEDCCVRPTHAADIAQSRLFEELLLAEIAELTELAASAEAQWRQIRERGRMIDGALPDALVRLHTRVAEVERLLAQLRSRFGYEADSLRVI